MREIIVACSL